MRSVITTSLKIVALASLLLAAGYLLITNAVDPAQAALYQHGIITAVYTPVPTAPPSSITAPSNNWLFQNMGAIIGAAATIIGALIAVIVPTIIKSRVKRNKRTLTMSSNQQMTIQDHIDKYCGTLQEDSRISQIQVLGMPQPLNIEDIYVHPRIDTNRLLREELDNKLHEAEINQNPTQIIAAVKHIQERRLEEGLDPDKAIHQHKRSIIVGEPGAGKTTLLKHLAMRSVHHELQGCPSIPIYIELSTFNPNECSSLLDLLVQQWRQYDDMPSTEVLTFLNQHLNNDEILLLLDGLDETLVGGDKEQAEHAYARTIQLIQDLVGKYPRLHIVVAVRKATYHNQGWPRLQGFDVLEIAEFTLAAIKTFVGNWFEASKIRNWKRMIRDLTSLVEHNSRIEELASNPLLLSLIVLVYKQCLELPEQRAGLYERCIDTLLTAWDGDRHTVQRRIFQAAHKRSLLKSIAWHFHNRGVRYFPEHELLDIIARFLPTINREPEENKEILNELLQAHGLIKEQAHGLYGFSHMTFQEYFAALYIEDCHPNSDDQLLETLLASSDKPWWEEVLLLYAGITSDASPLLRKMLDLCKNPDAQELLLRTNMLRAGHCLENASVVNETHLRETIVNELFSVLEQTPYRSLQQEIATILARMGGKSVNMRLIQLLSAPHPDNAEVYKIIAHALGVSGNQAVANELLTLLSDTQADHYMRARIALALGRLGENSSSIRGKMLALLTNPKEEWYVRSHLADALGELGDPSIAPELVPLLKQHGNTYSMYYNIAVSLGKLGNRDIIPDLQKLLQDNQLDDYARGSIVVALRLLADESIVELFLQLLKDDNTGSYIGCKIAKALSELERKNVRIPDLLAILTNQNINPEVRGEVSATLCALGGQAAISTLLQLLLSKQTDPQLQLSIVSTLGCLANPKTLAPLHSLLQEPQISSNLRGNIIAALGMMDENDDAPREILALFHDGTFSTLSPEVQTNMIKTLSHRGQHNFILEPDIIRCLLKELKDKALNVYVGRDITEALNMFNLQKELDSLLDLLADRSTIDPYIRQGIAKIIVHCEQNQETLQRLLTILKDTDIPDDIFEVLRQVRQRGNDIPLMMKKA